MIGVLGLSINACRIVRVQTVRGPDGDPVPQDTVLVSAAPCRFDQAASRTYSNMLQGDVKAVQIVARLYIDAGIAQDNGEPLNIDEKDKVYVDGKGEYQIYDLNRVQDATGFHHYEIDLLDTRDR
jgi:hypothetical protein